MTCCQINSGTAKPWFLPVPTAITPDPDRAGDRSFPGIIRWKPGSHGPDRWHRTRQRRRILCPQKPERYAHQGSL